MQIPPKLNNIINKYYHSDLYKSYTAKSKLVKCVHRKTIYDFVEDQCTYLGVYVLAALQKNIGGILRFTATDVERYYGSPAPENLWLYDEIGENTIAERIKICNSQLIILDMQVQLIYLDKTKQSAGHSTAVIIDKQNRTVEHFNSDWGKENPVHEQLAEFYLSKFVNLYFPDFIFLKSLNICPYHFISLQQLAEQAGAEPIYCGIWSLLYILHRVENPNDNPQDIINFYLSMNKNRLKEIIEAIASHAVNICSF